MPPAPSGLLALLLMAVAAVAATAVDSSVFATNELQWAVCSDAAAAAYYRRRQQLEEGQGGGGGGEEESPCPPPCPANSTKSTHQCLYYLQESHKEEVCGPELGAAERRRDVLKGLRMRHCCEHAVDEALPDAAFDGGTRCRQLIDELILVDRLVSRIACGHATVLDRYDCGQTYSIAHRCHHCKQAYRRWVCSSLVPHFTRASSGDERHRVRLRPCLSVCQDVEQQCPYLLPGDWTNMTVPPGETAHPTPQYAGEPTFLCLDPNIPETGEQRQKSSRGDEDCCYTHCGSPGRGVGGGVGGGSGSGGGTGGQVFGVCEHCPGRPPGDDIAATSESTATSAASERTRYKVSLLWTAWTIFITLAQLQTQTIYYNTLQCLLVLCATSVRTTLKKMLTTTTWTKTKCCGPCS